MQPLTTEFIPAPFFRLFDLCNSAPPYWSNKRAFYLLKTKILLDHSKIIGYDRQSLVTPVFHPSHIKKGPLYDIALARFILNKKIFHIPAAIINTKGVVIEPKHWAFPDAGTQLKFHSTINGLINHYNPAPDRFDYTYAYYLLLYRFSILSFAESHLLKTEGVLQNIIKNGGVRAGLAKYFNVNPDTYILAEEFTYYLNDAETN